MQGIKVMNAELQLHCIVYQSKASAFINTKELEFITQQSITRNKKFNVTGVLLCDGYHFIQYLEGTKESLQTIYEFILKSSLHSDIKILADNPIRQREFPKWFMSLMRISESELLNMMNWDWLINWDWWDNTDNKPLQNCRNPGIQKLRDFCERSGVKPAELI